MITPASALLIDPPWRFEYWDQDSGAAWGPEAHYLTLDIDTLCALPMQRLMAEDCAVFMWATWPTLPQALRLGEAWGLRYISAAFVWVKTNPQVDVMTTAFMPMHSVISDANFYMGMGYWSRSNTEAYLLFTRGRPKRQARNVRQPGRRTHPLPSSEGRVGDERSYRDQPH